MKGVFLTLVSSGIMLVLSFAAVVNLYKSIWQAIIIDGLFGFSSIYSVVNMPLLIFF
jgi:hypothetical protein